MDAAEGGVDKASPECPVAFPVDAEIPSKPPFETI
jgi:hypothetical protein